MGGGSFGPTSQPPCALPTRVVQGSVGASSSASASEAGSAAGQHCAQASILTSAPLSLRTRMKQGSMGGGSFGPTSQPPCALPTRVVQGSVGASSFASVSEAGLGSDQGPGLRQPAPSLIHDAGSSISGRGALAGCGAWCGVWRQGSVVLDAV